MQKQVKNELLWACGLAALALYASNRKKAALIPAAAAGWLAVQKIKSDSFEGHSAVITGGSRGLGLALAKVLVKEGAHVTLLARDVTELAKAQQILMSLNGPVAHVHSIVCDVTEKDSLQRALNEVAEKFGGIDLLINNAGAITVGPWETMEQKDFEAQMNLHVYAPMNAIRFSLPFLRRSNSGKRIVNICSMGGRVAVPHMLPYDTSKFALAGFSQGVAAELASEGISVTTIYPTLMRTGSPIQAVFKGNQEKEFAWFQAGDIFPGLSMDADQAAQKIIEAARERRWELMPSILGHVRQTAAAFFPEIVGKIMSFMGSLMPAGESREYKTGAQSRSLFDRLPFSAMAHAPEVELNQKPKADPKYNMGLH